MTPRWRGARSASSPSRYPTYVSWNYTLRSTDGHIAQHVKAKDVAWHAGNWYVNAKSIGLEHEGFLAEPDAWYTEAMYRSSARLVTYLARKYDIPLDRQHILGHDNVPAADTIDHRRHAHRSGPVLGLAPLLRASGAPLRAQCGHARRAGDHPPRLRREPAGIAGCVTQGKPCAPHGSSEVRLYSDHDETSALITDVGLGTAPTPGVNDLSSRVSTGQQYAVADRHGDWTAIWYLGQKAWFEPEEEPTAVNARGRVVTPRAADGECPGVRPGLPGGGGLSDGSARPGGVAAAIPAAGGAEVRGRRQAAGRVLLRGHLQPRRAQGREDLYYEIQFGHRVAFVRAADVRVVPSAG
ncbi:N-acetylmuramoyl-L-alanine amidase OS=Streptomyces alboniger OX=132473 GN=CP975_32770 PE=4 SV=1 [Streptomyces alboniger]